MFNYLRKAGTTDVSVVIRIIDSTDGTPETGVVYNTSGIDLEYRREGATSTDITEATLAGLDSAHADGGFLHIGNGYYRLDLPDAACAAGSVGVLVHGTVTGMVVIGCYIQLVAYDPFDTVRLGLTALPNAAANAAGGLPISAGGALALDTKLANTDQITVARMGALTDWIDGGRLDLLLDLILGDTGELQTDWVNGGRLDLLIDAIKTKTDFLPSATAGSAGGVFIAGSNAATSITTALTANITGSITGDLSGSVGSVGAGGIATTSFAAGAINAAAVAADAGTEIAAAVWAKVGATSSIATELLLERLYSMLSNKMTITEATGGVVLRNVGDSGDAATGNVQDLGATTVRDKLTWA